MADIANTKVGYLAFDMAKSVSSERVLTTGEKVDFAKLLEFVRDKITRYHSVDLANAIENEDATVTLRTLIEKYISTSPNASKISNISDYTEQIYNEMAGLSILTGPIYDHTVEEINLNGGQGRGKIEITDSKGTEFPDIQFISPQAATDTVIRMVHAGGCGTLDDTTPMCDSYLSGGTRIAAMIPPIVRPEDGVVASIRRQSKNRMEREEILGSETAAPEMLDFAEAFLPNGIPFAFAGAQSSGKTTDLTYFINHYIRFNNDINNRIFIIEDSREIKAITWDEIHNRPSRVVYTCVKPKPNPVTARDLVKQSLRFNSRILIPAEMRDGSAYDVMDAGNTGQIILTSLHAPNAKAAYKRILSLCEMANTGLSENSLMDYIVSALPIIIFKERQKDGSRKYAEIFEATGHTGGQVEGNLLFRFVKEDYEEDNGKVVKVHGKFMQLNNISDELRQKMEENGGKKVKALLDRIFPPDAVYPKEILRV
jgi:pilus assembly protein CpaF